MEITSRTEQAILKQARDQIFKKLKKSTSESHRTNHIGWGDQKTGGFIISSSMILPIN